MHNRWLLKAIGRFAISLFIAFGLQAKVDLAVSNATTGPASELGNDLNRGAELFFSEQSKSNISLHKRDDGYEPSRAMDNTVAFADAGHKLLFNYLGTPTTKAVFNYIRKEQLALIAPYTGADFLREQSAINIYNLRASYEQEAEFQARYFIEKLQLANIGIVIQADDFGLAFEKYFVEALRRHGVKPKFVSRFKRNSNNVMNAASQIKRVKVEAVVFIGTYEPMSTLINGMQKSKPELIYSSVSFVSSDQLIDRIPVTTKLLVTEVVPNPATCPYKECLTFLKLAKKHKVRVNHGSFEGYLNAYWLSNAIEACGDEVDEDCVLQQLSSMPIQLLGAERKFNKLNRQLLNDVFVTSLNLPMLAQ